MRKVILALSAATLTVPMMPAPVFAQDSGYYQGRTWRGTDGRLYCRKPNGTTGLIVGGAAGALVGREIGRSGGRYRYRNRGGGTTGAIIGGAIGALIGREATRC